MGIYAVVATACVGGCARAADRSFVDADPQAVC